MQFLPMVPYDIGDAKCPGKSHVIDLSLGIVALIVPTGMYSLCIDGRLVN